jgi:hypothetical protein
LAIFAAISRATSSLSNFAADLSKKRTRS